MDKELDKEIKDLLDLLDEMALNEGTKTAIILSLIEAMKKTTILVLNEYGWLD